MITLVNLTRGRKAGKRALEPRHAPMQALQSGTNKKQKLTSYRYTEQFDFIKSRSIPRYENDVFNLEKYIDLYTKFMIK